MCLLFWWPACIARTAKEIFWHWTLIGNAVMYTFSQVVFLTWIFHFVAKGFLANAEGDRDSKLQQFKTRGWDLSQCPKCTKPKPNLSFPLLASIPTLYLTFRETIFGSKGTMVVVGRLTNRGGKKTPKAICICLKAGVCVSGVICTLKESLIRGGFNHLRERQLGWMDARYPRKLSRELIMLATRQRCFYITKKVSLRNKIFLFPSRGQQHRMDGIFAGAAAVTRAAAAAATATLPATAVAAASTIMYACFA